jgi:diguanylate cyclase (GGDEF)-like protein
MTLVTANWCGQVIDKRDGDDDREVWDVLLVEDNLIDAQLIRRLLRRVTASYYRITHVRTLNDAVLSAEEVTPDLILADLNLPDSRGTETVASLQTSYPNIPLVIVSAWEDEAVSLKSVKAGAQDYLVKGHIDGVNLHRVIRYAVERKRTELELVRLAHYDQLTSLPNRSLLRERVEHAVARAGRSGTGIATLVLDMDRFKEINDMLGHEIGDKLLIEVAGRIRASVREQDTVARLGGDEFAVILEGVSEAREVVPVVERIFESLSELTTIDQQEISSSTSVGIAMYPQNGHDLSELLRAADLAMYQAKSSGRGRYQFFADAMQEEAQSRRALEWALRRAVEKGEFRLAYQPQLCLRSGAVIGVEALLRWMSPTRGLLTPYHFIAGLEEFGLIIEVGEWVLHTACEQLRRWHEMDFDPMRVSVNVSAQQFEDPMLIDKIRCALKEADLPPEFLEIELTESCLMADPAQAESLLREIRQVGVRVAIDDFGTGYSSLTYLHEFPLNSLKIDKSFVQGVESSERGGPISNMIIGLGQTLGLDVIAEGVETEGQLAYMRQQGCDIAQGYLYSRPEAPEELTPWLATNQRVSGTNVRSIPVPSRDDETGT